MKRKILALLLVLALAFSLIPMTLADDAPLTADVFVTISNAGELVLVREAVSVTDADGDGALTINDALIAAHDAKFEGGAEAGYASAQSDWGLSLTKLWGVENGGSYGYYVNDQMFMGLADPIATDDSIYAFVYKDTEGFSDAYAYFSDAAVEIAAGSDIEHPTSDI